jgi:hypothetical protein
MFNNHPTFKYFFPLVTFTLINFLWLCPMATGQITSPSFDSSWRKPDYTLAPLAPGIEWCETLAPLNSVVGDSKITIIKIDPSYFNFHLLMSSEKGKKRTVQDWADSFQLNIVFNAGMYDLNSGWKSRGLLQGFAHSNNAQLHTDFNHVISFQPKDSSELPFFVYDLTCDNWELAKKKYNCYAQGLRMIDCSHCTIGWNKRKQSCSMLVCAMDPSFNMYLIFSRSPYTHNQMIAFMSAMPFQLFNAIYLEGGPETSLFIKTDQQKVERLGSYVSGSYPKDTNRQFWKLPNVIGLSYKIH